MDEPNDEGKRQHMRTICSSYEEVLEHEKIEALFLVLVTELFLENWKQS